MRSTVGSRSRQSLNLVSYSSRTRCLSGLLTRTGFADSDEALFAHDFVFHFVNPHLAEFDGDHHGHDGFRSFFARLHQASDTGFHNDPHSLTLDVDAIVVWRIVDGASAKRGTYRRSTPCAHIGRPPNEPSSFPVAVRSHEARLVARSCAGDRASLLGSYRKSLYAGFEDSSQKR